MARFTDYLYLTERQVRLVRGGKEITVWREGKKFTIALKPKDAEEKRILKQIQRLKRKLNR